MKHKTVFVGAIILILIGAASGRRVNAQERSSAHSEAAAPNVRDSLRLIGSRDKPSGERYPIFLKLKAREEASHDIKPVIVSALQDKNAEVRCGAVSVLAAIAPNEKSLLPTVERLIDDRDASVRLQASCAAWTLGRSKKAIHEAAALLDSPDKTIRAYAATLIEDMGEDAALAAPKLVDRLSEPDEIVLLCVVKALDKVGHAALEPLLRKTNSPNARVRALAIACLDDMKVADRRVHEAFLAALSDADWDVRESAVGAVRKSKIRGPLVTEKLMALLNDPEDMICVAAAKTLAEMRVQKAIPAIENAIMNRRMSSDKEALAYCLGKLNAVSAIPTLEKMLQKTETQDRDSVTDRPVRVAIVTALGHMGQAAIPALERAKSDPEQSVREAAAESLQRISSEMKKSDSTPSVSTGECEKRRPRRCRCRCDGPHARR